MDALNPDEVQSYLHAPEFGRRLDWVRFRSLAGTGATGQVAPEPDLRSGYRASGFGVDPVTPDTQRGLGKDVLPGERMAQPGMW